MNQPCKKYREEDLILHLYGEAEDPGLPAHLEQCPQCRAWIEDAARLRELAAAHQYDPGDRLVNQVIAQARAPRVIAIRSRWSAWAGPVLAAAAAVLMIVTINLIGDPGPAPRSQQPPAYLTDLNRDLDRIERGLDREERTIITGADQITVPEPIDEGEFHDIEVSMAQVEHGFGIHLEEVQPERSNP